jgi:hypothetical protein
MRDAAKPCLTATVESEFSKDPSRTFPRLPILTTAFVSFSRRERSEGVRPEGVRPERNFWRLAILAGIWLAYNSFTLVRRAFASASWKSAAPKASKLHMATA